MDFEKGISLLNEKKHLLNRIFICNNLSSGFLDDSIRQFYIYEILELFKKKYPDTNDVNFLENLISNLKKLKGLISYDKVKLVNDLMVDLKDYNNEDLIKEIYRHL
jgi:hypothetical protein